MLSLGQQISIPLTGFGDLVMAMTALALGNWIYFKGPQHNRVMLRYWVLAYLFLFLGAVLASVLESMGDTMPAGDLLTARTWLAALYMAAGLLQLFGVLEVVQSNRLGKDLMFGISGAAYVIILIVAVIYRDPNVKTHFLFFSSSAALVVLMMRPLRALRDFRWITLGAFLQLVGVFIYFNREDLLGVSYSLILNLFMLAGMVAYLLGLFQEAKPVRQPSLSRQLTTQS